ncbi:DEAD/DEAH box helicase [Methylocella silvestris]|uniref:RNA helicase n=1 Tax=Methylocella silvestris TaxID=199596 RepID=A0A2J7TFM4_METSI|nr:DEAD/DEAH box helicase [Methylocella silvestris]PNG25570.1 RNA helicase [Methylocella silvestris]
MQDFSGLGLAAPLLLALSKLGYSTPTPIQAQAIPHVLTGRDLVGIAQTGTGKTAAFALPILHQLAANPQQPPRGGARVLVLSPTRELASQIAESFRSLGSEMQLSVAVVFGGVPHGAQIRALQRGLDVLVATPGRLVDHLDSGVAHLGKTEFFVLDEVDQMLDLGFVKAIHRIVRTLPQRRQNLFFSATMPTEIAKLAADLLKNPAQVSVTPVAKTADRVEQQVLFVETHRKRDVLVDLLADAKMARTIIFTRTKRGADKVAQHLEVCGVSAAAIHGNKSQSQRERSLASFRAGRVRALVATDIAARGIDVDGVTHVVNFDLPEVPEAYVHRIGRTARAGAEGVAISLCDGAERDLLRNIERLTRLRLPTEDRRAAPGSPESRAPVRAPQTARPLEQRRPPNAGPGRPQERGRVAGAASPAPSRPRFGAARPHGERRAGGDREASYQG